MLVNSLSHPRHILYNANYLESNYREESENIPGMGGPISYIQLTGDVGVIA